MASDAELKITAAIDDQVSASIQKLVKGLEELTATVNAAFGKSSEAMKQTAVDAAKATQATDRLGDSAVKTASELADAGRTAKTAFGDAASAAKNLGETSRQAAEEGGRGFGDLKGKLKDLALGLFGLQQAFSVFKTAVTDAVNATAEVDVINARIQNFTGETRSSLRGLFDDLNTFSVANKQFVKSQEVSAAALVLLKEKFSTTSTAVYDIREAFDFARVTGSSLIDSVRLLVEANKALGDGTNNSVEIFSRLNFLFGKGFDNAGALTGALSALSNTARSTGLRLDDAAVSLATLSETTSAGEAIRNLESILKTLQSRVPEVSAVFAASGKQFDETTVSTAGLRNVLVELVNSIKLAGGDAQVELKKLFGSQEAVNAVLVLGSENAAAYGKNVQALSNSTQKLVRDTNSVAEAQRGFFKFVASEGYDVLRNIQGGYEALDGTTKDLIDRSNEFSRAKAREVGSLEISTGSIRANSDAVSGSIGQIRSAIESFGGSALAPRLEAVGEGFKKIGADAASSLPAIEAWYATVSGQEVDADVERIRSRIAGLIKQAQEFAKIGAEGFVGEGLEFRLREIADYELLLLDELNAKREADRQSQLDRDLKASQERAARDLDIEEQKRREEEQTILLRQQAELTAYQENIRRIKESAELASSLVREALAGTTPEEDLVASISASIQPLADEAQRLQGVLANTILSEEDRAKVVGRLEDVRAQIRGIAQESVTSGRAFEQGFDAALNKFADQTANNFKMGAQLAEAGVQTLTQSFSTLFNDLVLGSKSASDAFKDFVKNFIAGIVQAINQIISFQIAAAILRSFGFAGSAAAVPAGGIFADGGIMPGTMGEPTKFAKGGIMAGTMLAAATGLPMHAYAQGGVTNQPQVAVFGEGRGAEAFVPLPGPNRGIPVEFQNTPSAMTAAAPVASEPAAPTFNITVEYNPSISTLDGRSTRELLTREARVIGDIVAAEIATGANRGLTDVIRGRSTNA